MAKLALLLALTLTAIVAFSAVSAYRTTITTTTIEDNGLVPPVYDGLDNGLIPPIADGLQDNNRRGSGEQCGRQISSEQLNHCEMHLTRPQEQQHLQQCCSQLRRVSEQCQCDAIQQVFDQARQQGGAGQMQQMLSKAQRLPNDCRLEVQDCPIRSPRVV
uniref:PawS-like protein 1b n=1 Tax=Hymenopappus tenuifolius TaxID=1552227 RepID=A0A1V0JB62_9ASTR|nr:PawS-like protein 1b [Hymenopappus tenuifolius]